MAKNFVFVGMTEVGNELAPNLLEAGFKAASSIETADVIFTFTPFQEDTEDVYFGTNGMVSTARAGVYLVNLSATSPSFTHEISALAQVNNMFAIDAPLLVHDATREHAFADRENLSMLVGGSEDDIAAVRDMLDALAADVLLCGGPGAAQLAKAAASLQRCAGVVSLIEADSLCRVTEGPEAAAALVLQSLAASGAHADLRSFCTAVTGRQLASSYSADIMLGEIVAALTAADDVELVLPQAESAEYLLQMLCTIGGAQKSSAALSLLYSDEAECARYGLDWARAEEFLDAAHAHDDECDCHDHHHHHHHDDYGDYDDFDFGYSPN